jgi:uncharacterized delta-60 repeat protein
MKTTRSIFRSTALLTSLLGLGCFLAFVVNGRAAPGAVDLSFDPPVIRSGLGGELETVRLILAQPDGKIVIGGSLRSVGDVQRVSLARLQSDGTLDTSFDPDAIQTENGLESGTGIDPFAIALQPDGKLIVGGALSHDLRAMGHIARLHPNGSVDQSFARVSVSVAGFPSRVAGVASVAVQPDGRILIGLAYGANAVNGVLRPGIARLEPDGSLDLSFKAHITGPSATTPTEVLVRSIILQPDGKILISGDFLSVGGEPRRGLARLNSDGSLDHEFVPDLPAEFAPSIGFIFTKTLALQPDGKIVVGGARTGPTSARGLIVRLQPDGRVDPTFRVALETTDFFASAIVVQPDGKILLAGWGHTINGVGRRGVARLHADGRLDVGFDPGAAHADRFVNCMALQPDGTVVLGGSFSAFGGVPRSAVVRLHGGEGIEFLPPLKLTRSAGELMLTWPAGGTADALLEFSNSLSSEAIWTPETAAPVLIGDQQVLPIEQLDAQARFYRLRRN